MTSSWRAAEGSGSSVIRWRHQESIGEMHRSAYGDMGFPWKGEMDPPLPDVWDRTKKVWMSQADARKQKSLDPTALLYSSRVLESQRFRWERFKKSQVSIPDLMEEPGVAGVTGKL